MRGKRERKREKEREREGRGKREEGRGRERDRARPSVDDSRRRWEYHSGKLAVRSGYSYDIEKEINQSSFHARKENSHKKSFFYNTYIYPERALFTSLL